MLKAMGQWLYDLCINIGLAIGLIKNDLKNAEVEILHVEFDPPSPSTVMEGEPITVEISYASNLKGRCLHIWAYGNTDGLDSFYEPSDDELATGSATRSFEISGAGHLDSIMVYIKHVDGLELLAARYPVDYNIIENPEKQALKSDGVGAVINIVEVRSDTKILKPYDEVPVGQHVDVVIEYQHDAKYEVRLWATPIVDDGILGGYDSGGMPADKHRRIIKSFWIDNEATIQGICIHMMNVADETIAEQVIEFPIHFV